MMDDGSGSNFAMKLGEEGYIILHTEKHVEKKR